MEGFEINVNSAIYQSLKARPTAVEAALAARAVGRLGDLYRAWRRPRGAAPLAGLHVQLASLDGLPYVSFAVAGAEAPRRDRNKKGRPHTARRQA